MADGGAAPAVYHLTVESGGSIEIPPEILNELGLKVGDEVELDHTSMGITIRQPDSVLP